jgi:hypothetical protein
VSPQNTCVGYPRPAYGEYSVFFSEPAANSSALPKSWAAAGRANARDTNSKVKDFKA